MNTINFQNTGGFPLDQNTLLKMQSAYESLQAFGALFGDKAIISGCVINGSAVSEGYIFLNNELFFFEGGTLGTNLVISETTEQAVFKDQLLKDAYISRVLRFGTGVVSYPWADFKRAYPQASALFIDEVRMFAGDTDALPFGWYLCDGQNSTADLRGRFVVGLNPADSDYNNIGKTGGLKEVSLSEAQMPSHSHTIVADGDFGGSANILGLGGGSKADKNINTSSKGQGQSHENLSLIHI